VHVAPKFEELWIAKPRRNLHSVQSWLLALPVNTDSAFHRSESSYVLSGVAKRRRSCGGLSQTFSTLVN
jgi:hypothetical protein